MPADAERSPLLRELAAALDATVAPGACLLVGVSGGPDSTALLAGVVCLAPARGWAVTAGHVEHGLRGAESRADRAHVEALATRLGVACISRELRLAAGGDLEARARRARHRALGAMAQELGASHVLLGHTLDDQAETVLLRLLRGAGRGGLGAMRPIRGRLVRPLLAATRADVRRFLAEQGLPFVLDRTNADLRQARNRVRRLALPFLAAEFNPRLARTLAALAGRLRDEDALLATLAADRLAVLVAPGGLRAAVADEPPALGRRIVRAWLERGNARGVSAAQVERVLALARGTGRGPVALPGPVRVLREGDRLVRRRGRAPSPEPFDLPVAPGETAVHPGGRWRLTLSPPRARLPHELRPADAARALFDAEALPGGLVLRAPRPGDRVRIVGVGTRKLSDVLIDAKVPREARAAVPVLEGSGEVLWVAGVVRGAPARLGPESRSVVEGVLELLP